MISNGYNRLSFRHFADWTAAFVSSASLSFFAVLGVLGLPESNDTKLRYADRACRLAKVTLDHHLPCLEDIANGSGKPIDREALWSVIRTVCVPASYLGWAFPCTSVNRDRGYVVIKYPTKDRVSFIVTPTVPIPGIESLTANTGATNRLWLAAWEERNLLEQASNRKLHWNDVALAVNSKSTRSQDQLHIHLGCINRSLRDFLSTELPSTANNWQFIHPKDLPANFFVKMLPEQAIRADLFKIVFNEIPGGRMFAEKQTIAVAGVTRGAWQGFALIVTLEPIAAEVFLAPYC